MNRHGTAADAVYEALYERIIDGDIPPQERLVETELTRQFRVSRTPVREALGRLVAAGLAERQPGGGIIAATQPLESILDTLRIFEVLEGLAARLAVERAGPSGIKSLRRALDGLHKAAAAKDFEEVLRATLAWNEALWRLAQCDQLYSMLVLVGVSDQRQRHSTLWREGRPDEVLGQLRALTDAIEERDADAAEAIARGVVAGAIRLRSEGLVD